MGTVEEFKQLLSEDSLRIELYDYLHKKCAEAVLRYRSDEVERPSKWNVAELTKLLEYYEQSTSDLLAIMALLGFWGSTHHQRLLSVHSKHFNEFLQTSTSIEPYSSLNWFPMVLQEYALGLGSILSDSYEALLDFFLQPFPDPRLRKLRVPQALAISSGISHAVDSFRLLPNRERQFTPLSEYLYEFLSTALEEILFFGTDFEYAFDRFEILLALQYSHLNSQVYEGSYWAPTGRFGYKYRRMGSENPYTELLAEASSAKHRWPPIEAGFFDGQFNRFEEVVTNYTEHLNQLAWH